jgi:aspartyl-tRNA(Asn)/glutamyl-tRNA(Gln) amidotransferase subunit C
VSVTFDDVRRIAALARLGVSDDRLPVLARELSGILEHMAVLTQVDTGAGASEESGLGTLWRADQGPPIPLLRPLTAFAPEVRDGFLVVPRLATHGGSAAPDAAAEDA